ncbi:heparan-alpha-glucosaminide N-acetyltransferase [Iris pallida]|uniref:Heparan-alpha-glucosaminide N-acetyltransferase n=1 Tax=Iris pallida TaxID=29817 RepID=A0AAX6IAJ1_IRIPA|nr:heparan-alpha-glucosaminide N-acetyltransferase [Iris pallida]
MATASTTTKEDLGRPSHPGGPSPSRRRREAGTDNEAYRLPRHLPRPHRSGDGTGGRRRGRVAGDHSRAMERVQLCGFRDALLSIYSGDGHSFVAQEDTRPGSRGQEGHGKDAQAAVLGRTLARWILPCSR